MLLPNGEQTFESFNESWHQPKRVERYVFYPVRRRAMSLGCQALQESMRGQSDNSNYHSIGRSSTPTLCALLNGRKDHQKPAHIVPVYAPSSIPHFRSSAVSSSTKGDINGCIGNCNIFHNNEIEHKAEINRYTYASRQNGGIPKPRQLNGTIDTCHPFSRSARLYPPSSSATPIWKSKGVHFSSPKSSNPFPEFMPDPRLSIIPHSPKEERYQNTEYLFETSNGRSAHSVEQLRPNHQSYRVGRYSNESSPSTMSEHSDTFNIHSHWDLVKSCQKCRNKDFCHIHLL